MKNLKIFLPIIRKNIFNKKQKIERKKYTIPIIKGKVTPARFVPSHITRPSYAETKFSGDPSETWVQNNELSIITDKIELEKFKKANQIAAEAVRLGCLAAKEGATTDDIDEVVHNYIISQDAYPTAINYHGFPKSVCTSVNEGI
jgi:methionyl aminopeptidase